jgi:RNA polymerase sigma-B factor
MGGSICERVGSAVMEEPTAAPVLEELPADRELSLALLPEECDPEVSRGEGRRERAREASARFREFYVTRDPRLRAALILDHNGLAQSIARRFSWPGLTSEDLLQIARMGLIHAVDRYDPFRGAAFTTYATHTITGEIKRYLRDHGWPVKVPRQLRELLQQVRRGEEQLTRRLRRPPSTAELAEHLQLEESSVLETRLLVRAATPVSIEAPLGPEEQEESMRVGDYLIDSDEAFQDIETRLSLLAGLDALDTPQREVVRLRYFYGLTQSEVAQRLSLSQMHISRVERRALARLRGLLGEL